MYCEICKYNGYTECVKPDAHLGAGAERPSEATFDINGVTLNVRDMAELTDFIYDQGGGIHLKQLHVLHLAPWLGSIR